MIGAGDIVGEQIMHCCYFCCCCCCFYYCWCCCCGITCCCCAHRSLTLLCVKFISCTNSIKTRPLPFCKCVCQGNCLLFQTLVNPFQAILQVVFFQVVFQKVFHPNVKLSHLPLPSNLICTLLHLESPRISTRVYLYLC